MRSLEASQGERATSKGRPGRVFNSSRPAPEAPQEQRHGVGEEALPVSASGGAPWELLVALSSVLRQAVGAFLLLLAMALGRLRTRGARRLNGTASLSVNMRFEYHPSRPSEQDASDPVPILQAQLTSTSQVVLGAKGCRLVGPPSTSATVTAGVTQQAASVPYAQMSPAKDGQRFAYVTLITRDSYMLGVQCLARSLRAAACRFPLLVLHTPDTLSASAAEALEAEGCQMVPVQRYIPPGRHNFGQYKLEHYAECWTKLRMWEMEGYDRLAYLDADMVVCRNIDALFWLPPGFYAAGDCAYGRPTQAERDACALFCQGGRPAYFNAGLFVMSPSAAEFRRFGQLLGAGAVAVGGYAEQDFLNAVYKGSWRALPYTFNAQKVMRQHHPALFRLRDVCVLHFVDAKPWRSRLPWEGAEDPYRDLEELWWAVFEGRQGPWAPAAVPVWL